MATIIHKDGARPVNSGRPVEPVAFSFADMRGQRRADKRGNGVLRLSHRQVDHHRPLATQAWHDM